MNLLCVDDDPTSLTALTMLLERLFPEAVVDAATGGEGALSCLAQRSYEVVLTDLSMPDRSGLELLQEIRQHHPRSEVLIITGHGTIDAAVEAMRLGARDFLEKPVRSAVLQQRVGQALEAQRQLRETEDLRLAQAMTEAGAGEELHRLEGLLQCAQQIIARARQAAINPASSPTTRLAAVVELLNTDLGGL